MTSSKVNLSNLENNDFSQVKRFCKKLGIKTSRYTFKLVKTEWDKDITCSIKIKSKKNSRGYLSEEMSIIANLNFVLEGKTKKDKFIQSCKEHSFDLKDKIDILKTLKKVQDTDDIIEKLFKDKELFDLETVKKIMLYNRSPKEEEKKSSLAIQDIIFNELRYKNLIFSVETFKDYKPLYEENLKSSRKFTYSLLARNKENCSSSIRLTNIFGFESAKIEEKKGILSRNYSDIYDFEYNEFPNFSHREKIFSEEGKSVSQFLKECDFLNQDNFLENVKEKIIKENINSGKVISGNEKIQLEFDIQDLIK